MGERKNERKKTKPHTNLRFFLYNSCNTSTNNQEETIPLTCRFMQPIYKETIVIVKEK